MGVPQATLEKEPNSGGPSVVLDPALPFRGQRHKAGAPCWLPDSIDGGLVGVGDQLER